MIERDAASGRTLGWRFGRLFVYTRPAMRVSLMHGGCMVTYRGRRKVARHVWWRICWVHG